MLEGLLEFIARIANRPYQERVWVACEGPECDDFDETMVYFFDESEPILKNPKDYGISNEQYRLLLQFHEILDGFSDRMLYFPAEKIIFDPEWQKIQEMAREVLGTYLSI